VARITFSSCNHTTHTHIPLTYRSHTHHNVTTVSPRQENTRHSVYIHTITGKGVEETAISWLTPP